MAKKIQIDLHADTKRANAAIKGFANQTKGSLNRASRAADTANKSFLKVGNAIKLMTAAAAAFAAIKLVKFLKDSVTGASNLEEATSRLELIFGDLIDTGKRMQKSLVANFAMTSLEAADYLSDLKGLLDTSGLMADESANLSNILVQLAADLGSAFNVETADALRAIKSGLIGQAEPMRKFNTLLSETRVKAEGMRMGLVGVKEELTEQQKVQARANIILQDTSIYVGDMSRTMGGFANQVKLLNANIQGFKDTVGKPLMNALKKVIAETNKWVEANQKLIDSKITKWVENFIIAVKGLYKVLRMLTPLIILFAGIMGLKLLGAIVAATAAFGAWVGGLLKSAYALPILKLIRAEIMAASISVSTLAATFKVLLGVFAAVVGAFAVGFGIGKLLNQFKIVQEAAIYSWGVILKSLEELKAAFRITPLVLKTAFFDAIYRIKLAWANFINWLRQKLPKQVSDYLGMDMAVTIPVNVRGDEAKAEIQEILDAAGKAIKEIDDRGLELMRAVRATERPGAEKPSEPGAPSGAAGEIMTGTADIEARMSAIQNMYVRILELRGEDEASELAALRHKYEAHQKQAKDLPQLTEWYNLEQNTISEKYTDLRIERERETARELNAIESARTAYIVEQNRIAMEAYRKRVHETRGLWDQFFGSMRDSAKSGITIWENFGQSVSYNLENLAVRSMDNFITRLVEGGAAAINFKELMGDMARSVLLDITRMIAKMLILRLAMAAIGMFGPTPAPAAAPTTVAVKEGGILPGGFQAFQGGGVITKPTLGLIGEGSQDEAVIPLRNGKVPVELKGGSGNVQVINNINIKMEAGGGGNGSKENTASNGKMLSRMIADAIDDRINKQMRPGGILNRSAGGGR